MVVGTPLPARLAWKHAAPPRLAAHLAVLVAILCVAAPAAFAQESTLVITYEDPCPAFAKKWHGLGAGVGYVQVELEKLNLATCNYLKEQITESVNGRVEEIKGQFTEVARAAGQAMLDDFNQWLKGVAAKELGISVDAEEFEARFQAWLAAPERQVEPYLNGYLQQRGPNVMELMQRAQEDTSREIVDGLKALWKDTKEKLDALTRAYEEAEKDPETPTTEILEKWGLSGEWMDRFKSYEGRFRVFDERYKLIEASQVLYDAFQAEKHRDRIAGLFTLLGTIGDVAGKSEMPGISFMGQVVGMYGQAANEALKMVVALEGRIRKREGYCIGLGAHALEDKRDLAFRRQFGDGVQACPVGKADTLEGDIYQQTEPQDADQLYFWLEDKGEFVKGRPGGGGLAAVRLARRLIEEGAERGFAELEGKKDDLATIAALYDTPYADPTYGTGLQGIWSEAVPTIEGIQRRLRELGVVGSEFAPCPPERMRAWLQGATGLRAEFFPGEEEDTYTLELSFTLDGAASLAPDGVLKRRGGQPYERYRRVWGALKGLSVLDLDGVVREAGKLGEPCVRCGGAELRVVVRNGEPISGCEATRAGETGAFRVTVATRSADLAVTLSATVAGRRSEAVTVDRRSVSMTPYPFGRRTENVTVPIALEEGEEAAARADVAAEAQADSAFVKVPDIGGMTLAQARNALASAGLVLGATRQGGAAPSKHLVGRIVSQDEMSDTLIRRGAAVGVSVYDATVEEGLAVPDLVGMKSYDAEKRLIELQLSPAPGETMPAPSAGQAWTVRAQSPLPGTAVQPGASVRLDLWGAAGSAAVPPPSVVRPAPTSIPQPPPTPVPPVAESGELAGVWDTTRGMVVRIVPAGGSEYTGILVSLDPAKQIFIAPGERCLTATRTGQNTYMVTTMGRHGWDGEFFYIGPVQVTVHGDSAQAWNLVWRRLAAK